MRASRRGSGDCVGRLRRASSGCTRYVRVDLESHPAGDLEPDVATRPASSAAAAAAAAAGSGSSSSSSMVAQRIPPEAWPQFVGYIRGRGERGWSAPQSLIGRSRCPSQQRSRILDVRTQGGCFRFYTARTWCLRKQGTWRRPQWRAQCGRDQVHEYATRGSNPGLADPMQVT